MAVLFLSAGVAGEGRPTVATLVGLKDIGGTEERPRKIIDRPMMVKNSIVRPKTVVETG